MKTAASILFSLISFQIVFLSHSRSTSEQCSAESGTCPEDETSICSGDCNGIALLGNPGTGKSTILNGLVDGPKFRSGYSFGSGLTQRLDEYKIGNITFFDTPGLNDISTRKEAGKEIDLLLQQNVGLKLAFVITLQSGRLYVEDINTMHLILDAITLNTQDRFGVIVNKMTDKEYDTIITNSDKRFHIQYLTTKNGRNTSHWCFLKRDERLTNADNQSLVSDDVHWFFRHLPVTKANGTKVNGVDTDTFDEKLVDLKYEHDKKMKRLEMMAKILGMVAAGTVALHVATGQGWILNHVKDASAAAWIGQQLPLAIGMSAAGSILLNPATHRTASTVYAICKRHVSNWIQYIVQLQMPNWRSINSRIVQLFINGSFNFMKRFSITCLSQILIFLDVIKFYIDVSLSSFISILMTGLFYILSFLFCYYVIPNILLRIFKRR